MPEDLPLPNPKQWNKVMWNKQKTNFREDLLFEFLNIFFSFYEEEYNEKALISPLFNHWT